jgi:hypothetical protein
MPCNGTARRQTPGGECGVPARVTYATNTAAEEMHRRRRSSPSELTHKTGSKAAARPARHAAPRQRPMRALSAYPRRLVAADKKREPARPRDHRWAARRGFGARTRVGARRWSVAGGKRQSEWRSAFSLLGVSLPLPRSSCDDGRQVNVSAVHVRKVERMTRFLRDHTRRNAHLRRRPRKKTVMHGHKFS